MVAFKDKTPWKDGALPSICFFTAEKVIVGSDQPLKQ
jgi:hypothetical protein